MYIALNEERIVLNFDKGIRLRMSGPDLYYLIELREYPKNDDTPLTVESFPINVRDTAAWATHFNVPIEFYGDFEINVFKYVKSYGMNRIFTHRYTDYSKLVRFNLMTDSYEECSLWLGRVKEYTRLHGCIPIVNSKFDEINKSFQTYYNISGIDIYKTYNIGRFPKDSTDFRTLDHRKEGLIWYGTWKTFWSYQHPRKWTELSSQEIVDDILGLS